MTEPAIVEREGNLPMAGAAVSAFDVGKHGVAPGASLGSRENLGMTEFAAVPDGMFFVRENNRVDPGVAGFDGKIFPALHRRPLHGDAF